MVIALMLPFTYFITAFSTVQSAQFGVVGPIVFSIAMLLFLLSMIVVGGMGTIWGPLLGAAVLMLADEGMRELGLVAFEDAGHGRGGAEGAHGTGGVPEAVVRGHHRHSDARGGLVDLEAGPVPIVRVDATA